jgi:Nucleoside-diphosphate-sugar epimerases
MHVLVTGAAGFIGFHLAGRLLAAGHTVVGIDNLNDYYSVELKKSRLQRLLPLPGFTFQHIDLADDSAMMTLFAENAFTHVVNLAAQAGVRYSLKNPSSYTSSNVQGFLNILEGCRQNPVEHLVFASSSSVYGLNAKTPFSVHDTTDHPVSLYAATKKSNEMMAHAYSHLFNIPCTGLRFFTVYGPWGRPDMALYIFTDAIMSDKPIPVFNNGKMKRDFTYIDDIIKGVIHLLPCPPAPDPNWNTTTPDTASSSAPYALYNIGNNNSQELGTFISTLEKHLGKKAIINYLPMQPGDVTETYADIDDLAAKVGFCPSTSLDEGIARFVQWYREYHLL